MASGGERRQISGHKGIVWSLKFAPDGKLLAAASWEAPVYLRDPYAPAAPDSIAASLGLELSDKHWQGLADPDAARAFDAMCDLIAHPDTAVPVLQTGWRQVPRATPAQMQQWLKDLDNSQFNVRQRASTQLEKFATGHEELLRQARTQTPSLESRRRLSEILDRQDPERLRGLRMLEVLERIATPPARQFIETLSKQTDDAELARQAAAGVKRLRQGPGLNPTR